MNSDILPNSTQDATFGREIEEKVARTKDVEVDIRPRDLLDQLLGKSSVQESVDSFSGLTLSDKKRSRNGKRTGRNNTRRVREEKTDEVFDVVQRDVVQQHISEYTEEEQVQGLKIKVHDELRLYENHANVELHLAPIATRDLIETYTVKNPNGSFYIVDLGTVVDKYLLWKKCFPRVEPFYAVKSNPDIEVSRTLNALGTGFDCASKGEMAQTLAMGVDPNNIIFANPCKPIEHILYAKDHGIDMMTFDNMHELLKIYEFFPEARLVLRLLPDDSHSLMPFGSKFGASYKDALALIAKCEELGMALIGCSFHVGSGCYSSIAWVEALKLARSIFDEAEKYGYHFTFLDIGGGFPGSENGPLPLSTIGPDVTPVIDELFASDVRVIGEPGRFFCTEASTLAVTIVSKRERLIPGGVGEESGTETQYYVSDGVYGSFNCIIFDHYKPEPICLSDATSRETRTSTVFGPTCDSMDCIIKGMDMPEMYIGEWMYFTDMGAYTLAAASAFNGFAPPVAFYVMKTAPQLS